MIEKADLTPRRLLAIWWAMTWRSVVFVFGGSIIAGSVVGAILGLAGLTSYTQVVSVTLGGVIGILGGLWCLRESLTRKYKGFELSISLPEDHF